MNKTIRTNISIIAAVVVIIIIAYTVTNWDFFYNKKENYSETVEDEEYNTFIDDEQEIYNDYREKMLEEEGIDIFDT